MNRAIAVLFILFSTLTYSQQNISERIDITFTISPNGHIIIPAKVNGVEGNFVFDTGAGLHLLTQDFADKVKDLEETHHFHTGHRATGEEITSDLWNSETLEIGSFTIEEEMFAVYDFDFSLDGLISLTPFSDKQITIDFENKLLSIESEKSLQERISNADFEMPIKISNDKEITIGIATEVQLNNDLSLLVNLDSGAGFDVYRFNSRYLETLDIDSTTVESEYRNSYFKPEEGNTFYFTSVAAMSDENKNVSVKDFNVSFIDGLMYEGIMGINWIGEKITIDIPNKRLIVQE
ncbi:hypothetical protein GCM10007103_04660 [Salinimicrobium marinum]|uniref:Aspartyl protease n=1 Tax=Salinimicrobium marinum TaxID=680283 RepID=A0A918S8J1_9FLAO|nr:retropepsin-like aspartic protease [Salinimicrobium marinum]GHA26366.1 hypothetical protein GCM10007103_04660 [Salinimicrobium marinum]